MKGQPWPLKLIYSHCLIRFSISSAHNNDFGFNSIKKINFSKKKKTFKERRQRLGIDTIKYHTWPWCYVDQVHHGIIWTNLVGHTSPIQYYIQISKVTGLLVLELLKGFDHILSWRSSWSSDQKILYKFWLPYHKEPYEIWVQLGQWFVRKLCFNILRGLDASNLSGKVILLLG